MAIPSVHLFFPCAGGKVDEQDGGITIRDPIYALYLPEKVNDSYSSGIIFFYAHIVGGLGTVHCRIEAREESGKKVVKSMPATVTFSAENRFIGLEFLIEFPEFTLEQPGIWKFALFANYAEEPIATTEIRFLERGL